VAALLTSATDAAAWGATGHRLVSGVGAAKLPDEVPSFLRTGDALATVRELGPEPDRVRDAGETHDRERDQGHFIDLDDDGAAFGIVPLASLPATREAYDTALRAGGKTQYQAGYLPYAIIDGWQQLRKDFAMWRVAVVGAASAQDAAERALFEGDRRLRERLIVRDLGVWSHYIGDGSQPLHLSIHFNGWGDFPNPKGYTNARTLHAFFESEFVRKHVDRDRVAAAVRPYEDCACPIEERTKRYLRASHAMVIPLYDLELKGSFANADAEGVEFVVQRLAAGAAELRDMIVDAWRSSLDATVGFPRVSVREIEARGVVSRDVLFGSD
jgi:hypothetical protein